MGTIANKLDYLNDTKTAIKEAIVEKGVEVADTDTFRSYAEKIGLISSGGGGPQDYSPIRGIVLTKDSGTYFGYGTDGRITDASGNYIDPRYITLVAST